MWRSKVGLMRTPSLVLAQAVILNVREGRLQKNSILEKLDVLQTVVSKLNLDDTSEAVGTPVKHAVRSAGEAKDSPLKRSAAPHHKEPWLGSSPCVACEGSDTLSVAC